MTKSAIQRVIISIGGTDREFLAQEHAAQMAQVLDVPLYAVHVAPDPEAAEADMFAYVSEMGRKHHVKVETRAVAGTDAGAEIVAEARPNDLIVIGTRRINQDYHLGSVTFHVIRHAECPVQVVRLEP